MLGLRPWDYGRMCPAEFAAQVEGRKRAVHQQEELAAWVVANLMNVSMKTLKRPITVAKLLGRVVSSSEKREE